VELYFHLKGTPGLAEDGYAKNTACVKLAVFLLFAVNVI